MPLGPAAITERYPVVAFIGLGSNLGEPRRQLQEALELLNGADEVEVQQVSTVYLNPPLGPPDQPWYVNAVAKVRTRLSPEELWRVLRRVEESMGRVKGERWGPRILDLDLLLFGGEIITGPGLTVPHPEMHLRAFVLLPLAEIAPEAWHPVLQNSAAELLRALDPADLAVLRPVTAGADP